MAIENEAVLTRNLVESVSQSIDRLRRWLNTAGWLGYDPYDVLGREPFLTLESLRIRYANLRRALYPFTLIGDIFPRTTRALLGIKKTANPKAAAVLARSYLNLYESTRSKDCLSEALTYIRWLIDNPAPGFTHLCWGYPFHWQSHILLPSGTPSAIVTCIATQAFLHGYLLTGEKWLCDAADDSCRFLTKSLHRFEDSRGICFSYTPIDDFRIHNANLMVATTLALMEKYSTLHGHHELIRRAVAFSLHDKTDDGGFFYWDREYAQRFHVSNRIDSLHTGYVIESLSCLSELLQDEEITAAAKRALNFYRTRLIFNYCMPIPRIAEKINPLVVDIHDCAEAIIVFSKLYPLNFVPSISLAADVARWTIKNMQDDTGYFHHAIYRWGRDRFPYVRWGQAWMMYALSELLRVLTVARKDSSGVKRPW